VRRNRTGMISEIMGKQTYGGYGELKRSGT